MHIYRTLLSIYRSWDVTCMRRARPRCMMKPVSSVRLLMCCQRVARVLLMCFYWVATATDETCVCQDEYQEGQQV